MRKAKIFQLGIRPSDPDRLARQKYQLNILSISTAVGIALMAYGYYMLHAHWLFRAAAGGSGLLLLAYLLHAATGALQQYRSFLILLFFAFPVVLHLAGGGFEHGGILILWSIFGPILALQHGQKVLGRTLALLTVLVIAGLMVAEPLLDLPRVGVDEAVFHYYLFAQALVVAALVLALFYATLSSYEKTRQEVLIKSAEIIGAYDELEVQKQALRQNLEEMRAQQEELVRAQQKLQASQHELQELNSKLEDRVKDRTAELSNAMQELKATQGKMVESEKMATLGNLVAGVAHEINTPVGIAVTAASHLEGQTQSFVESIKAGALKKTDLVNYLNDTTEASQIILKNLERASALVQSFKKVAVNQNVESVDHFDLHSYLNDVILSLKPQLKQTKLEVVNAVPEGLSMYSLPSALSQIFINFISNSIRYGYEPGQVGRLEIKAEPLGADKIRLTYSDDGKGIPPENVKRIFEPFFTTGREKGGTGLGLNIVYNLVRQKLQGDINVTSELGKGTTFVLDLPLKLEETQEKIPA